MQERLLKFSNGMLDKWNVLEKGQKIRLGVTALIVLAIIGASVYFITKPNYVPLASNLTYTESSVIKNALDDAGILNKIAPAGSAVLVRKEDVPKAEMLLVKNEVNMPKGFTWDDALSASGMGATETIKKENIRRSIETDLAEKLVLFDGIGAAKASLALPDDTNFFIESKQNPSVAAFVTTNRDITPTEGIAMARQIQMSVVGLTMDNIEITDQNYNMLYSGAEQEARILGTGYEMELQRKKEIDTKINSALKPLFPDIRVVSNIALKMDKVQSSSSTLQPPVTDATNGVVLHSEETKESATNANTDAEPGVQPNAQTAPGYQNPANTASSGSASSKITDYGYNKSERVIDESIGTLIPEQSAVSVYAYRYRNYDQDYMTANNLLGGQRWEDFKVTQETTLTPIQVDQAIIDNLRIGTGINNLALIAYEIPTFTDSVKSPLQIGQIVMFAVLALLIAILAFGFIKKTQADEVTEIEPELSVEDLIVSTQLEEEKEEEMRLKDIDILKESETKRQIEKFVLEKPESVAHLLRNWLNDDWE